MQGHWGTGCLSEDESFWSLRGFAEKHRQPGLTSESHLNEKLSRNGSLFCLVGTRDQPGFGQPAAWASLRGCSHPYKQRTSELGSKETLGRPLGVGGCPHISDECALFALRASAFPYSLPQSDFLSPLCCSSLLRHS